MGCVLSANADHGIPIMTRTTSENSLLDNEYRIYWVRQGSPNGALGLGGHKYWVGPAIANQGVKITFDAEGWRFMLHMAGRDSDIPLAPHGLTKAVLMGAGSGFARLPSYQVALPLDSSAWRTNQHAALFHQS